MNDIKCLLKRSRITVKTFLTLQFLFLGIETISAQNTIEKVDLHRIATLEFPQKPLYKVEPGIELYSAQDSTGYCYIAIKDYKVLEPMFFVYKKDLKDYYKGVIQGTLGSFGKLIRQQSLKEKGIEFIDFEFETEKENEPNYVFARSYYINRLLIVQQYRTYKAYAKSSKSKKDHFFQSLKFTNQHKPLQQGVTFGERVLFMATYYATFVVIIGGVLALIGFIIYRITIAKHK
jgi:hypothetical protein